MRVRMKITDQDGASVPGDTAQFRQDLIRRLCISKAKGTHHQIGRLIPQWKTPGISLNQMIGKLGFPRGYEQHLMTEVQPDGSGAP